MAGVRSKPRLPVSVSAGQTGPSLMTFSSLLPSLHQCKYICLSALLAVIKEEGGWGGGRLDPDRDTDSRATVQPGGRNWEKQRWQRGSRLGEIRSSSYDLRVKTKIFPSSVHWQCFPKKKTTAMH